MASKSLCKRFTNVLTTMSNEERLIQWLKIFGAVIIIGLLAKIAFS